MKNSETKDFIAYEYLSLNVKEENISMYVDCYENFGWQLIKENYSKNDDYYINHNANEKKMINIKFKRDRKIKNKQELNNLQKKTEISLNNIDKLKNQPDNLGMIVSMLIGIAGTIFMALSVFSITATNPLIIPCIIFGFLGMVGWAIPYFAYTKVKIKKETENTSLIEEQLNIVYDNCERASTLIK